MTHEPRSLARLRGFEAAQKTAELRLLRAVNFPWVMSILTEYLSHGPVAASEFHEYVDLEVRNLQANGIEIAERESAREYCNTWVNNQWISRTLVADEEQYELTAATLDVVSMTDRLINRRSTASESRLKQIIDAVARLATDANPDAQARVERIDEEIARLQGQRQAFEDATYAPTAPGELREQLDGINDLARHLPSDFKRVSDSVYAMHKKFVAETKERGMTRGEMLREFFTEHDLLASSDEGRAFQGLMALLSDSRAQAALRRDISDLLQQDFAATLTKDERSALRDLMKTMTTHGQAVQNTYRRLTQSLDRYVETQTRDDHLLTTLLAQAHAAATKAFDASKGRRSINFRLGGTPLDVDSVSRLQILDPRLSETPPPLTEDYFETETWSLEQLRERGGPRMVELVSAVNRALVASLSSQISAADVFATVDDALRRPQSIVGLLQLAARHRAVALPGQTETVQTTRPDGSSREQTIPLVIFTAPIPAPITLAGTQ